MVNSPERRKALGHATQPLYGIPAPFAYWLLRQVLRFLTAAGAQQSGTLVVGGNTAPTATSLLEKLQQAAYFSPLDSIAGHFLRPVLTPAFKVKLGHRITLLKSLSFLFWRELSAE